MHPQIMAQRRGAAIARLQKAAGIEPIAHRDPEFANLLFLEALADKIAPEEPEPAPKKKAAAKAQEEPETAAKARKTAQADSGDDLPPPQPPKTTGKSSAAR